MLRLATRCENCMHVDVCNKRGKYELVVDKLNKSEISISLKENSMSFVKLYSDPDFDVSVKCSYFIMKMGRVKNERNPNLPIEATC